MSASPLVFRKTQDMEPQAFRLYIALFPIGTGGLCVRRTYRHRVTPSSCHLTCVDRSFSFPPGPRRFKYSSADTTSKHWGLVLKDSTGVGLLDVNDLDGLRKHEVRDFTEIRKNHLKMICEVANLGNDELTRLARTTAASEKIPTSEDGYFCRTWVVNTLESLKKNHVELYDDPKTIQRAVQHIVGEFDMQYGPKYHIVAPLEARVRMEYSQE